MLALAVALLLFLAIGVGSTAGGGLPFVGDDEESHGASGLPSDWAGLEPLLPLAPGLKDIAALKSTAAGGASRVVAAESGGGGALRVRALPEAPGATTGGSWVAEEKAGSGRSRPVARRAPAPRISRLPLVRRILGVRLGTHLGATDELLEIIEKDLRNVAGLPIDIDIDGLDPVRSSIPPINVNPLAPLPRGNPLPGGSPLPVSGSTPGTAAGGASLNLTVVDSQADSRFDVLLVARGRRLLEAYRFRDRDIAGLATQINLRSAVLVADLLRDGRRLERVTAAPLRSATAGDGSRSPLTASVAGRSRGGTGIDTGPGGLASTGSGARGRPLADGSGRRSSGRSAGGGTSSSGPGSGTSSPHRSTSSRRSLPTRRSTPTPPSLRPQPKPRRGEGRSKAWRPSPGRRWSGGHDKGHARGHARGRAKGHATPADARRPVR